MTDERPKRYVKGALAGITSPNGRPEFRSYVYRGTGRDTLTPGISEDRCTGNPPGRPRIYCEKCGNKIGSEACRAGCGDS